MKIKPNRMSKIVRQIADTWPEKNEKLYGPDLNDESLTALVDALYVDDPRRPSDVRPAQFAEEIHELLGLLIADVGEPEVFPLAKVNDLRARAQQVSAGLPAPAEG